jgi:hypothetical protein
MGSQPKAKLTFSKLVSDHRDYIPHPPEHDQRLTENLE